MALEGYLEAILAAVTVWLALNQPDAIDSTTLNRLKEVLLYMLPSEHTLKKESARRL